MLEGIDRAELLSYLEGRSPISTGSVRQTAEYKDRPNYDEQKCRLISTDSWLKIMSTSGPKFYGRVHVSWQVSQTLMFRLEFPRRALEIRRGRSGSRSARLRMAVANLYVVSGSYEEQLRLSRPPEYIDFGTSLQVIPIELFQAASLYADLNPDPLSEPVVA